ncbi:MAG: hypothetical protein V9822_01700 [Candidatus Dasytiphilus stammeri]
MKAQEQNLEVWKKIGIFFSILDSLEEAPMGIPCAIQSVVFFLRHK